MWARVDDAWWSHPKVVPLSAGARGLWISALSWSCHQRRDVVPVHLLPLMAGTDDLAAELVQSGLWAVCDEGWRIHQWDEYQQKSISEKRAEAGSKGGQVRARNQANGKQKTFATEAKPLAGPSLPIPSRPEGRGEGEVATPEPLPAPEQVKANVPHVHVVRDILKAVGE